MLEQDYYVAIPKWFLECLLSDFYTLDALERNGVDNWEGYEDSFEDLDVKESAKKELAALKAGGLLKEIKEGQL